MALDEDRGRAFAQSRMAGQAEGAEVNVAVLGGSVLDGLFHGRGLGGFAHEAG